MIFCFKEFYQIELPRDYFYDDFKITKITVDKIYKKIILLASLSN